MLRESPHAAAARAAAAAAGPTLAYHPTFPDLPASVPLTYTLSMHACLSERPTERPSFAQVATLLRDVAVEVSDGCYVNSHARVQVRLPLLSYHIIRFSTQLWLQLQQRPERAVHACMHEPA